MKKLILTFFASTAFTVLPPLAQGIRERQALLNDPRFYGLLGSAEIIESITQTDSGYLVLTQNYSMKVDVIYEGRGEMCGPIQFDFEFNAPESLRQLYPFQF